MYTVLLVEDEEMIRKAIKKVIPWNDLGFQLVGELENGKETIEYLKGNTVDVVITDICMPFVDGLELSEYIRNNNMKTKILIITGHDDFEYAKQALKLGVYDYVLKPITAVEFSDVLIKLKKKMDEENEHIEYLQNLKKKYKKTVKTAQDVFFKELLTVKMSEEVIEKRKGELSLDFSGNAYQVAALKLGQNLRECKLHIVDSFDIQILNFAVLNIIKEVLGEYSDNFKVFDMGDNIYSILYIQENRNTTSYEMNVNDSLKRIMDSLEYFLDIKTSVGLGRKEKSLSNIYLSYEEALSLLEYQVILGHGKIIRNSNLKEDVSIQREILKLFKSLEYNLKFETKVEVYKNIDDIFNLIINNTISISTFKSLLLKLLACLINVSDDIIINPDKKMIIDAKWVERVFSKSNIKDIKKMYVELCDEILKRAEGQDEISDKMRLACLYIEENYSNPELCVKDLCDYLYVSPSYFSKTFKEETGKTFLEYLNDVRLKESIKLLIYTDLHSYEIADRCGFKDPQYFSQWFKGKTEHTPKQYRNLTISEEQVYMDLI